MEGIELMRVSNLTHDYPRHIHEEFCILIMLRGAETYVCRGKSHQATAGNLMLLNAHEAHSTCSVNAEYRAIHIQPKELLRVGLETAGLNSESFYFPNPVIEDRSTFRFILDLHLKLERKVSPLEQESVYLSALHILVKRQAKIHFKCKPIGKEPRYIELVRDYLRSNYAENVSLSELASLTNLSPFHLLRVFRNQTGVPPHEYQTQVRVIQAGRLLRKGRSILEAAYETGFCDQSHLSRHFKRITGMTPGFYLSHSNIVQDTPA